MDTIFYCKITRVKINGKLVVRGENDLIGKKRTNYTVEVYFTFINSPLYSVVRISSEQILIVDAW